MNVLKNATIDLRSLLCRTQVLRAAGRTAFEITTYGFMPDHLHLLVEGIRNDARLPAFVKRAKQMSSYHAGKVGQRRIWQTGSHDRVVREDEDPRDYARYIVNNPVRRGLVENAADYPHCWTKYRL